jgi:hypothetical protein
MHNGGDARGVDRSLGPGAVTLSESRTGSGPGLRPARRSELAVAVGGWLRYLPAVAAAPSPGGHILPHLSAVCDCQRLRVARRGGTWRIAARAGSRVAVEGLAGGPADAEGWVPRLTEDLRGPGDRGRADPASVPGQRQAHAANGPGCRAGHRRESGVCPARGRKAFWRKRHIADLSNAVHTVRNGTLL